MSRAAGSIDTAQMLRRHTGVWVIATVILTGVVSTLFLRVPIGLAEWAGCSTLMLEVTSDIETGQPVAVVTADGCVDSALRALPGHVSGPSVARVVWEHLDRPVERITVHFSGGSVSMTAAELSSQSLLGSAQPMSRGFDLYRDGLWHLLPLLWLLLAFAWFRAAKAMRSAGVVLVMVRD